MGKIITDIQEYSFSKKSTQTYNLSLIVSLDRLSYLISDNQQNILVLRSTRFDLKPGEFSKLKTVLKEDFLNDNILSANFASIRIGIQNNSFTLIPSKLFTSGKEATYLDAMINLDEHNDLILSTSIPEFEAVLIAAFNHELIHFLNNYFSNPKLVHSVTPWLKGLAKMAEHHPGQKVFVNSFSRTMVISFFEGKDLVFCNAFDFRTSTDFLYFIMLVYDQFKLKPESVPLFISGQIIQDSEIYQQIIKYIRHPRLVSFPLFYQKGKQLESVPEHFYFDLFSLKLCE